MYLPSPVLIFKLLEASQLTFHDIQLVLKYVNYNKKDIHLE